jgi:hypothetical protein
MKGKAKGKGRGDRPARVTKQAKLAEVLDRTFHDPKTLKELNRLIEAETAINVDLTTRVLTRVIVGGLDDPDIRDVVHQCVEKAKVVHEALLRAQQQRVLEQFMESQR